MPTNRSVTASLITCTSAFCLECGTHLLWAHRAYKAKWPLRLFYTFGQTLSLQYTVFKWASDHRVHHKWSDTDGDPHNPSRGFTYAHIGWVYRPKHPELTARYASLDFSDLWNDPIVKIQYDYYVPIVFLVGIVFPVSVPVFFWNESLITAVLVAVVIPMVTTIHMVLLINSAAHMWGDKPYNTKIPPVDNAWIAVITFGAGYHNYHHMFPSDYTSSEAHRKVNFGRELINLLAKLGLAYDLKTASKSSIERLKDKVSGETRKFHDHVMSEEFKDSKYEIH
ncbi:Delta(9)-fatty-acid desaturase fat-6 [Halotydeus destructor]|nr:Delta(9)-fatty-acid desaturase fat-6 [Halotydeus destructor]